MFANFRPKPKQFLIIFILINLIFGFFIVDDFGISSDEAHEYNRSNIAFSIYTNQLETDAVTAYSQIGGDKYYGTAATMIGAAVNSILSPIFDVPSYVYPHYTYFFFFQIGLIAFYFMAVLFIPEWYALFMTVLFGTQPLYFGHAFINPKDIPLMSVFLAAVTAGFYFVDQLANNSPPPKTTQWSKKEKILLGLVLFILAMPIFKIMLFQCSDWIITYAYQAPKTNPAHLLFKQFTTSGSLEGYLTIGRHTVYKMFPWMAILSAAVFVYFSYQVWRHKFFGRWVTFFVLMAGGLWGYAISTRVVALAAGGIVGLYALIVLGKKAIPYLISYVLSAVAVSTITWPFLWYFGIQGFLDALRNISDFPEVRKVLFEGQLYTALQVPDRYLPKLMLLQFTEPVVLLAGAGLVISIIWVIQKKLDWKKISLLLAWFALPLIYTIANHTVTYNNFRQYLFITPPLFILAGLALHAGLSKLNGKTWKIAVGAALLLPGLISLFQLHPYEYIYYNQFTGGVAGAYRQYELDYWKTANKEIAEYVDTNVESGSSILEAEYSSWLNLYVEEDKYNYVNLFSTDETEITNYDYAILPTTDFYDLNYLPNQEVVYQVERDDSVLIVLKKID